MTAPARASRRPEAADFVREGAGAVEIGLGEGRLLVVVGSLAKAREALEALADGHAAVLFEDTDDT